MLDPVFMFLLFIFGLLTFSVGYLFGLLEAMKIAEKLMRDSDDRSPPSS